MMIGLSLQFLSLCINWREATFAELTWLGDNAIDEFGGHCMSPTSNYFTLLNDEFMNYSEIMLLVDLLDFQIYKHTLRSSTI